MVYDSVTTWRLYAAEQSVPLGDPMPNIQAARSLVRSAQKSAWWREHVEYVVTVKMKLAGQESPEGWVNSYSQPHGLGPSTTWTISLHPSMLNDLVVLHELAHCIAPRWWYSGKRRRPNQVHTHIQHAFHDAGFAGAMAELVREFGEGARHDDLRDAYAHFGVPVMSLDEYKAAVSESLLAEADVVSMEEEFRQYEAAHPRPEPPPGGWVIPTFGWGDQLFLLRSRSRPGGGRLGRDPLAAMISPVEKCSRRDIERIEGSQVMPDDPRLRRIAMCLAVALNMDPIYARHQMGLVRWDCNVELDELRIINAGWVELVETMNRLLQERPPRWAVDGER